MIRFKLQLSRDRFRIRWETTIKAEGALVSTFSDQGVDEKQIGFAGGDQPPTVGGHVNSDDGISECG